MCNFLKSQHHAPPLSTTAFCSQEAEDIVSHLRRNSITVENIEHVALDKIKRLKPTLSLQQFLFVDKEGKLHIPSIAKGLSDVKLGYYFEGMAAIAIELRKEPQGPDAIFVSLLPLEIPIQGVDYIACIVQRMAGDVVLKFITSFHQAVIDELVPEAGKIRYNIVGFKPLDKFV